MLLWREEANTLENGWFWYGKTTTAAIDAEVQGAVGCRGSR